MVVHPEKINDITNNKTKKFIFFIESLIKNFLMCKSRCHGSKLLNEFRCGWSCCQNCTKHTANCATCCCSTRNNIRIYEPAHIGRVISRAHIAQTVCVSHNTVSAVVAEDYIACACSINITQPGIICKRKSQNTPHLVVRCGACLFFPSVFPSVGEYCSVCYLSVFIKFYEFYPSFFTGFSFKHLN